MTGQLRTDFLSALEVGFLETFFMCIFYIESRCSNPSQWLPGEEKDQQEAVQRQGTGIWHWVECGRMVGGKDEAGIKLGRTYEFTLWDRLLRIEDHT